MHGYIVNPKTKRLVKIGSKTFNSLVREGIIQQEDENETVIADLPEDADEEETIERIKVANETLPVGKQAVRGRGKYKGKIVKRSMPPSSADIGAATSKVAASVVTEKIKDGTLYELDDQKELEDLIWSEILKWGGDTIKNTKASAKQTKKKTFKVKEEPVIEELTEPSEDSEDDEKKSDDEDSD